MSEERGPIDFDGFPSPLEVNCSTSVPSSPKASPPPPPKQAPPPPPKNPPPPPPLKKVSSHPPKTPPPPPILKTCPDNQSSDKDVDKPDCNVSKESNFTPQLTNASNSSRDLSAENSTSQKLQLSPGLDSCDAKIPDQGSGTTPVEIIVVSKSENLPCSTNFAERVFNPVSSNELSPTLHDLSVDAGTRDTIGDEEGVAFSSFPPFNAKGSILNVETSELAENHYASSPDLLEASQPVDQISSSLPPSGSAEFSQPADFAVNMPDLSIDLDEIPLVLDENANLIPHKSDLIESYEPSDHDSNYQIARSKEFIETPQPTDTINNESPQSANRFFAFDCVASPEVDMPASPVLDEKVTEGASLEELLICAHEAENEIETVMSPPFFTEKENIQKCFDAQDTYKESNPRYARVAQSLSNSDSDSDDEYVSRSVQGSTSLGSYGQHTRGMYNAKVNSHRPLGIGTRAAAVKALIEYRMLRRQLQTGRFF